MIKTLVDCATLAAHLGDPDWLVADCRYSLTDPDAGARAYAAGHVPGAHYFHLDRDLAGPIGARTGRHPLPEPQALAEKLRRAGLAEGVQLVAYDDAHGAFAARLWWLARWLGHPAAAVLDGGWQRWLAEGGRVSTTPPAPAAARPPWKPQPTAQLWLTSEQVWQIVRGERPGRILDARAPARFRGEVEPLDPVAGHVPGAVNLPYAENVLEDGRFRPAETLRRRFLEVLGGRSAQEAVCMCGSGVTACHNLLAMEIAGLSGARLYPGSWSEWIRDPARPVARGTE